MKLEVNKIKQLNKGKLLSSYMSSPLTLEFPDFSLNEIRLLLERTLKGKLFRQSFTICIEI